MIDEDSDNLLNILQAHGQQFLNSFIAPSQTKLSNKRKRTETAPSSRKSPKSSLADPEDSEEEWGGIGEVKEREDIGFSSDIEDFEQDDDAFTGESSTVSSKVVVFEERSYSSKPSALGSRAQMKAFMSSKVSKLRQDIPGAPDTEKTEEDKEDERSNAQNDAILHRLVHTKLLSGSLNPELDLTPAHRRKALAGRILELSGGAKLGKGEKSVREKERNKALKRVREGIVEKQKERGRQELEEAKDLGNYHPTIKKLFESSETTPGRKRDRGLKMGVGKFSGGLLKLSREEITIAEGGGRGRGRGFFGSRGERGRGRGRGRGKGRGRGS